MNYRISCALCVHIKNSASCSICGSRGRVDFVIYFRNAVDVKRSESVACWDVGNANWMLSLQGCTNTLIWRLDLFLWVHLLSRLRQRIKQYLSQL